MGRQSGKKYSNNPRHKPSGGPVRAKKYLGQHFLTQESIVERIADSLSYEGYNKLVEIGPGTGILTKFLMEKPVDLLALDVDRESVEYLNTVFLPAFAGSTSRNNKVEIVQGDFLKFDLLSYYAETPFAVIGNFPYNISSQILFRVVELRDRVPELVGMFQKEVAERVCASEGNKTYGIMSVLVQAFYDAEYLFTVGPEVFSPPPKVDSGVLRLTRRPDYSLPCDEALFFRVVKTSFNQRRKTLRNSLKSFQLSDNLKEDAIFDRRPEELAVADFIALTEKIDHDTV